MSKGRRAEASPLRINATSSLSFALQVVLQLRCQFFIVQAQAAIVGFREGEQRQRTVPNKSVIDNRQTRRSVLEPNSFNASLPEQSSGGGISGIHLLARRMLSHRASHLQSSFACIPQRRQKFLHRCLTRIRALTRIERLALRISASNRPSQLLCPTKESPFAPSSSSAGEHTS